MFRWKALLKLNLSSWSKVEEKKDEGGENEYWTAEDVWREIRVGGPWDGSKEYTLY